MIKKGCFIGDLGMLEQSLGKVITIRDEQRAHPNKEYKAVYVGKRKIQGREDSYDFIRTLCASGDINGDSVQERNFIAISEDGQRISVDRVTGFDDRIDGTLHSLYLNRFREAFDK